MVWSIYWLNEKSVHMSSQQAFCLAVKVHRPIREIDQEDGEIPLQCLMLKRFYLIVPDRGSM